MANVLTGIIILGIIGAIFFISGIYVIVNELTTLRDWKTTDAHIENSSVYYNNYDEIYSPEIDYVYTYKSHTFSGHCCGVVDSMEEAEKIVSKNPVGKTIRILVNPTHPEESRLKDYVRPFDMFNFCLPAIGIVLLVSAVMLFNRQNQASQ